MFSGITSYVRSRWIPACNVSNSSRLDRCPYKKGPEFGMGLRRKSLQWKSVLVNCCQTTEFFIKPPQKILGISEDRNKRWYLYVNKKLQIRVTFPCISYDSFFLNNIPQLHKVRQRSLPWLPVRYWVTNAPADLTVSSEILRVLYDFTSSFKNEWA